MELNKKKPTHRLFHSFCTFPKSHFESQVAGEVVVLMLRQHPIVFVPWALHGLLALFILVFLNFFIPSDIVGGFQRLYLNLSVIVFILSYYWFRFLSYFFNVGIVTTRRMLDIDFSSVLFKEVSETRLDRVEDISAHTSGYVASMVNYGNVFVQTAGDIDNFEFHRTPNPGDVVRIINQLIAYESKHHIGPFHTSSANPAKPL